MHFVLLSDLFAEILSSAPLLRHQVHMFLSCSLSYLVALYSYHTISICCSCLNLTLLQCLGLKNMTIKIFYIL